MNQSNLNRILQSYKAQPAGDGYIDIIVSRENYKDFVSELTAHRFTIQSVSWWEWCPENEECKYGLGGPRSLYFDGWFAEIPTYVDDLEIPDEVDQEQVIQAIIQTIEAKQIVFSGEAVSFKESNWLTPAFWLDVPNDW